MEVFETFEKKFNAVIMEGYGLTEGTWASSVNPLDKRNLGSIGLPLEGQEMKIQDGEICIEGPNLMQGYYKNPEATAETMDGEWLKSGDLGRIEEDGFVYVTGRLKEIYVNSAGKNIAPLVVEETMKSIPLVSQCMLVGLSLIHI